MEAFHHKASPFKSCHEYCLDHVLPRVLFRLPTARRVDLSFREFLRLRHRNDQYIVLTSTPTDCNDQYTDCNGQYTPRSCEGGEFNTSPLVDPLGIKTSTLLPAHLNPITCHNIVTISALLLVACLDQKQTKPTQQYSLVNYLVCP